MCQKYVLGIIHWTRLFVHALIAVYPKVQ